MVVQSEQLYEVSIDPATGARIETPLTHATVFIALVHSADVNRPIEDVIVHRLLYSQANEVLPSGVYEVAFGPRAARRHLEGRSSVLVRVEIPGVYVQVTERRIDRPAEPRRRTARPIAPRMLRWALVSGGRQSLACVAACGTMEMRCPADTRGDGHAGNDITTKIALTFR